MLNKPYNYEEAKAILKRAPDDDFSARYRKVFALRGLIVTVIMLAAAVIIGIVMKKPFATVTLLPAVGIVGLAGFAPLIHFNVSMRKYRKEEFYARTPAEQIMDMASRYVDEYNDFKRGRK